MSLQQNGGIPTYTIIQADGLYEDDTIEQQILNPPNKSHAYKINYQQTHLSPDGVPTYKPWSTIDKSLRDQVDGITLLKPSFTAADLELFPKLKVLVRMGVGYDRVDRAALAKRGVTLCNVPDYGTAEIADHALSLTLTLRRGIALHHDHQRGTPPSKWCYIDSPLISRIQGATFGILGFGLIGTAVALRAKAFGWNILFYDPYVRNGIDKALGVERTRDLKELFRRSSVVSVHCPSSAETRGMVNEELLRLMAPGSILVNTARGDVVDLDAVERCLRDGPLAGVGLDVVPGEPVVVQGPVHSLLRAYRDREEWLVGRMVVTPHCAFHSPQSLVDIRVKSVETMRDVLVDGLGVNVIPPPLME
ncbi:C-terminal binding protein [Aspergillus heteromorphus CBS 117.55]|uniref:C-terminal binding protein n=1 Tax=Aspergillus heteromorphus CBS 117.55 TaxID=1448321 RepID=A0A317VQY6_9EURO|nr:C-terminal binding protein [Aspergillus heteromorphus CBS 117.55]PWY75437.1 C-terminal binding protein [Aspergillus heteromorphus CBS 117.55]